ncbi:dephospho-CoA kinase, partial [Chloroflexi bacterium]|nr:dephospho-CoA kinase [Chloroflexota bacterium]
MPLIIGVTGAIASGKSTACKILENLGATHSDADKLVHRMYDPGKPAFKRIVESFGEEVIGGDGFVDRKILGS